MSPMIQCEHCDAPFNNIHGLSVHNAKKHKNVSLLTDKKRKISTSLPRKNKTKKLCTTTEKDKQSEDKPPSDKPLEQTDTVATLHDEITKLKEVIAEIKASNIELQNKCDELLKINTLEPNLEIHNQTPPNTTNDIGIDTMEQSVDVVMTEDPTPSPNSTNTNGDGISEEVAGDVSMGEQDPNLIKCNNCTFSIATEDQLREHMRNNHINPCTICQQNFETYDKLTSHMENGHEETGDTAFLRQGSRYACRTCGMTRNTRSQMEKHTRDSHAMEDGNDDGTYTCNHCPNQYTNRDQLQQHVDLTHISCNNCDMTFASRNELNTHIAEDHKSYKPCRNYNNDNNNTCEYDSECRFSHIVLAEGEHICYKCGSKHSSKKILMQHIKMEHGSELCKRFIEGRCSFGNRCVYTHGEHTRRSIRTTAPSVERHHQTPPMTTSIQDFPYLPTIGNMMVGQNMLITVSHLLTQIHTMLSQMGPQ